MATEFKVEGLAEIDKALKQLPAKIERNVLRGTVRAAAMVMRNSAKSMAPVNTGALKRSLRVSTNVRDGRVTAEIIAGGGKQNVWYAHMVEFGAAAHTIKPKPRKTMTQDVKKALAFNGGVFGKVQSPGITPRPFMRTAMDTSAEAAFAKAVQYAKQRLVKEVEKIASRNASK